MDATPALWSVQDWLLIITGVGGVIVLIINTWFTAQTKSISVSTHALVNSQSEKLNKAIADLAFRRGEESGAASERAAVAAMAATKAEAKVAAETPKGPTP